MLWTDLEVGDELKIISLYGAEIIEACPCSVCSFYKLNLNKVVKVVGIDKIMPDSIKVNLMGVKNTQAIVKLFNDDFTIFKIHALKDD